MIELLVPVDSCSGRADVRRRGSRAARGGGGRVGGVGGESCRRSGPRGTSSAWAKCPGFLGSHVAEHRRAVPARPAPRRLALVDVVVAGGDVGDAAANTIDRELRCHLLRICFLRCKLDLGPSQRGRTFHHPWIGRAPRRAVSGRGFPAHQTGRIRSIGCWHAGTPANHPAKNCSRSA